MIPRSAITHWNKQVPWEDIANVEQDLIITRALTDIFSDWLSAEVQLFISSILHPSQDILRTLIWYRLIPGPSSPSFSG